VPFHSVKIGHVAEFVQPVNDFVKSENKIMVILKSIIGSYVSKWVKKLDKTDIWVRIWGRYARLGKALIYFQQSLF
jgi:hypothetical protein